MDWSFLQKNWIFILLCLISIIIGVILSNVFQSFTYESEVEENNFPWIVPEEPESNDVHESISELIVVDVKGEVSKPGIYEVEPGDRVFDVILKAGGFTLEAEERGLNLAEKCYDEMVIFVPTAGEDHPMIDMITSTSSSSKNDGKVKVNQATQEQLTTIPGIGPAKAQAILKYIDEHGPFKQVEELVNVPGIGEKTMEGMREYLIIP
ncbi:MULTISPECIES: helix-hairpin-helix domain-containing protein [Bacillaceae]|uniref:Helix-hairpin-helix domain-containing protein n=1 Tax=Evansella alkalicola TaxID=745819 RepID=A0ABS6JVC0_9BACI|nr:MULTISPECIES: helix-hairpin-helix domain-containing protein [Bacillaceae]MBU9722528.1 helix-hairpin-helix domain-containing protein [Bacillus alkalicola]